MFSVALLPLQFDPAGLQEDYRRIGTSEWTAHFNTAYFSGDWSGIPLHAKPGVRNPLLVNSEAVPYDATGVKDLYPHLHEVIEAFKCPLRAVRLLKLSAGSIIREHQDYDLGYENGEVRIHVPVLTNPQVEFYLDNKRVIMNPGECWYLDLQRPHRVHNRGTTDRIHLVVDCILNDWLRDIIGQGKPYEGNESSFEDFRLQVLANPELQAPLMDCATAEDLMARCLEMGEKQGFDFIASDVQAAMRIARETSIQKMIK